MKKGGFAHLTISMHLNPQDMMGVPVVLELIGPETCKELGTQPATDLADFFSLLWSYWLLWDIRRTSVTQFNPLGLPVMTLAERLQQMNGIVPSLLRVRFHNFSRFHSKFFANSQSKFSRNRFLLFSFISILFCSVSKFDTTELHDAAAELAIFPQDGRGNSAEPVQWPLMVPTCLRHGLLRELFR